MEVALKDIRKDANFPFADDEARLKSRLENIFERVQDCQKIIVWMREVNAKSIKKFGPDNLFL